MRLWLTRKATDATILEAGGDWDRLTRKFAETPQTTKGRAVPLNESQVEFTEWFAGWLDKYRAGDASRERLALCGGERRGGKTFDTLFCAIAFAVAVPNSIVWLVSPTYPMRDELERTVKEYLPRSWYTYRDMPVLRFTLANGSIIQSISADEPEKLKRGRADVVLFNEAQMQARDALTYGIPATIDRGGIAILAANPPRQQRGEWVLTLREAIDANELKTARYFGFDASLNTDIDQAARKDVGAIMHLIDPRAAAADHEDAWIPVGERAYPKFDKRRHLGRAPDVGDITAEVTRKKGRAFPSVAGADFQGVPHQVAVVCKVFANPGGTGPIYAFTDEVICDEATEDDLIDEIESRGFAPETLKVIGDASGAWQDGAHKSRGRGSYDVFKARRYLIEGPRKKISTQGTHAKNPDVADRLGLVMKLMAQDRIIVDPVRCPRLAEAFKECPVNNINGRKKPGGYHSHITDAAGYVLFWLEPPPKAQRTAPSDPRTWLASTPFRQSPI